jgi:alpha-beta hydrolase superfamily lysophospholipase
VRRARIATPQLAAADATALSSVSSAIDAAERADAADFAAAATALLQSGSDLAVNVARFWQHGSS